MKTTTTCLLAMLAVRTLVPGAVLAQDQEAAEEELCVLETSLGTMAFRFFDQEAPLTTANFKQLVRDGFYDGKEFYRVVKGHVIQAGDGGENDRPTVKGEFGAHPHVVGAVGLARDQDPDSGSTEFYVCHAPRPHLDGNYAVFGLLVEGFDVLETIGNVEVEEHWVGDGRIAFHKPKQPVVVKRAYLERRAPAAQPEASPTPSRETAVRELTIHEVVAGPFPSRQQALREYGGKLPDDLILADTDPRRLDPGLFVLVAAPVVTSADLARVQTVGDPHGQAAMGFTLTGPGGKKLAKYTSENVGKRLAILLDQRVELAAGVRGTISHEGMLTGSFTFEEMEAIVDSLSQVIAARDGSTK